MQQSITLTPVSDLTFLPAFAGYRGKLRVYGLSGISKKAGVYFIKENGILVYVGMSTTNLQERLYRHFQHWKRKYGQHQFIYYSDLENNTYEVACITTEKDEAHPMEKAYILELSPRDNKMKYESYSDIVEPVVLEPTSVDGGIVEYDPNAPLPF